MKLGEFLSRTFSQCCVFQRKEITVLVETLLRIKITIMLQHLFIQPLVC